MKTEQELKKGKLIWKGTAKEAIKLGKLTQEEIDDWDMMDEEGEKYTEGYKVGKQEAKKEFKQIIYQLDWIKIMNNAINSRKTSWNDNPIREWRNASDEVCSALIRELEDKKIIPSFEDTLKKDRKKIASLSK